MSTCPNLESPRNRASIESLSLSGWSVGISVEDCLEYQLMWKGLVCCGRHCSPPGDPQPHTEESWSSRTLPASQPAASAWNLARFFGCEVRPVAGGTATWKSWPACPLVLTWSSRLEVPQGGNVTWNCKANKPFPPLWSEWLATATEWKKGHRHGGTCL